jgi:GDP-4-dehydro-6-deoxy-D-mannose reductase
VKVLVTGAGGFAGGFLVQHLLESGDEVLGSSRQASWPTDLEHLAQHVQLVDWDITSDPPATTVQIIRDFSPDAVFHLAGLSIPRECGSREPTAIAERVNIDGAVRVARLAGDLSNSPRFVFVSSCYVYGAQSADAHRVSESAPPNPTNGYGVSKWLGEQAVAGELLDRNEVVVIRSFNHTGPRQSAELMLPEWCSQFAKGGPVRIHSRNSFLDLTDVRDTVNGYRLVAEFGKAGDVYNLGSGVRRRSGDILEMLLQRYDANREIIETSPNEQFLPIADIGRVKTVCGWQPRIPLGKTIEDTMEYWKRRERQP